MIDPLANSDIIKLIKDLQRRVLLLESKVITNINFSASGYLQVPQLSADPASGQAGQVYYNTATGKFRKYDAVAVAWKNWEVT